VSTGWTPTKTAEPSSEGDAMHTHNNKTTTE
jgi:hypothetical protein